MKFQFRKENVPGPARIVTEMLQNPENIRGLVT